MISPLTLHRFSFALLFAALSGLVIFTRILPMGAGAGGFPPPDLIVLIGFAWVLRRPDFVPVLLFAAVMLLTDFLFLRPPGVTTALAVLGLEALRARAGQMRERSFGQEWITVAVVLVLMMLAERILLALFMVGQPGLGLTLLALIANLLFYPVVVAVSVWGFRVRRLAPGEHAAEARLV